MNPKRPYRQLMYSNYNVLTLPYEFKDKYEIGDTYKSNTNDCRELKFDGLTIRNIDFCFGLRLHFHFEEWSKNIVKPTEEYTKKSNCQVILDSSK